jgi:RNA polymerase sigma factor (sigma-70 family)
MSESLKILPALELIAQCGRSDEPAFWLEFVRRYHRRIILSAVRMRRSYGYNNDETNAIADISQEVYLRLLANNHSVLRDFRGDSESALHSYLSCVVHSVVVDQLRREMRQNRLGTIISLDVERGKAEGISLLDLFPANEETSPDRMLSDRLAPERLRELLKTALSGGNAERDALVFQLHIINGLSMREISEIESLKMSLVNVESVIRRTRERLRAILKNSDSPGLSN